jgi:hypothetical protein
MTSSFSIPFYSLFINHPTIQYYRVWVTDCVEISVSQGGKYEDDSLMGYPAILHLFSSFSLLNFISNQFRPSPFPLRFFILSLSSCPSSFCHFILTSSGCHPIPHKGYLITLSFFFFPLCPPLTRFLSWSPSFPYWSTQVPPKPDRFPISPADFLHMAYSSSWLWRQYALLNHQSTARRLYGAISSSYWLCC